MRYTIADLEVDIIRRDHDFLAPIRADRGNRYGTEDDILANVARGGWERAVDSADECVMRLNKMVNDQRRGIPPNPADLLDASRDLTNYSHYIEILFHRSQNAVEETKPVRERY